MKISRRLFVLTGVLSCILARGALAGQQEGAPVWDGTWVGDFGRSPAWPISITIVDGKVASYLAKGAPFNIQYSEVTQKKVSFGDRDNYSMILKRTSAATASARVHGRHGDGFASLIRLP